MTRPQAHSNIPKSSARRSITRRLKADARRPSPSVADTLIRQVSSILRLGPLRSSNLAPLLIDILRHLGRRSKLRPAQIQPVKLIT